MTFGHFLMIGGIIGLKANGAVTDGDGRTFKINSFRFSTNNPKLVEIVVEEDIV